MKIKSKNFGIYRNLTKKTESNDIARRDVGWKTVSRDKQTELTSGLEYSKSSYNIRFRRMTINVWNDVSKSTLSSETFLFTVYLVSTSITSLTAFVLFAVRNDPSSAQAFFLHRRTRIRTLDMNTTYQTCLRTAECVPGGSGCNVRIPKLGILV